MANAMLPPMWQDFVSDLFQNVFSYIFIQFHVFSYIFIYFRTFPKDFIFSYLFAVKHGYQLHNI